MIPLRDSTRSRTFPIVNVSLIVINFIVFFKEISLSNQALNQLTFTYGLIPAHVASQLAAGAPLLSLATPFITAMFLHANWLHIIGNMLYLWIFGDNVEDRVGHLPYLFLYLLVGVAGSIVYCLASPASQVPHHRRQWGYRRYPGSILRPLSQGQGADLASPVLFHHPGRDPRRLVPASLVRDAGAKRFYHLPRRRFCRLVGAHRRLCGRGGADQPVCCIRTLQGLMNNSLLRT